MKEDIHQPVTANDRYQVTKQVLQQCGSMLGGEISVPCVGRNAANVLLVPLTDYIADLVENAFIAGSLSVGGVGLNLSKEERSAEYLKLKGLRT